jgi:hypothetical protein
MKYVMGFNTFCGKRLREVEKPEVTLLFYKDERPVSATCQRGVTDPPY